MTLRWLTALLFFLLMLVPLPFLPEYGGANSTTRLMLTAAIVEERSTQIDRYAPLTVDKAEFDGHFYSDKAPGMALLALPSYALGRALSPDGAAQLFRFDQPLDDLPRTTMLLYRAIVWLTGGLLMAAAGTAMFRMGLRLGGTPRIAFLASASMCLATPVLGWSLQFFGHVGAGAALALAFALSTGFGRSPTLLGPQMRALVAGAALSLAVSIEYTAAPAAVMVALYAAHRLFVVGHPQALRLFLLALGSALVAAAPMLFYHWVSFGNPFHVGYSSVVGFEGMEEGLLGLTLPDPKVLWEIIFGLKRGILWLSPLLILIPLGIWRGLRVPRPGQSGLQAEMLLCLGMILYYFLLNASYFYWHGGASVGPRHALPAVFFMVLPSLVLWQELRGWIRWAMRGLFALSLFFSLATASVTMIVPTGMRFPLKDPVLEGLLGPQNVFARYDSWGLSGSMILILWGLTCVALASFIWRMTARQPDAAPPA